MATGKSIENYTILSLEKNRQVFELLLDVIDKESVYWKPAPDKWCMLEIVCHLYDEEREDFRARVKHALETPDLPLKPIDPVGWVSKRQYLEQKYPEMVANFLEARDVSLKWLNTLKNASWENKLNHPELGTMTAGKFLVNWLAHDYLHFRQINRLKYQYLKSISSENLQYAGRW